MMLAELHIHGMPKPFPFIYLIETPNAGDKIIWEYKLQNGENHQLQATVFEINSRNYIFHTLVLTDFTIIAIQKDPTTQKTNMSNQPNQPQVFIKTVKGERNTCEIKVFLNSELLQLPPILAGGDPVLEFGHRIEVAIPGTRPLALTSTSKKLETALGDANAIAELFADKVVQNNYNEIAKIPYMLGFSEFLHS